MVIDSSAVMAIVFIEPDALHYYNKIVSTNVRLLSAATLVETSLVVMRRRSPGGLAVLDDLIKRLKIEVISVDEEQAILAREAFRRFGKGRHRACLNYGDCFSYALAKQTGLPLLFKGNDFSETDLESA